MPYFDNLINIFGAKSPYFSKHYKHAQELPQPRQNIGYETESTLAEFSIFCEYPKKLGSPGIIS